MTAWLLTVFIWIASGWLHLFIGIGLGWVLFKRPEWVDAVTEKVKAWFGKI